MIRIGDTVQEKELTRRSQDKGTPLLVLRGASGLGVPSMVSLKTIFTPLRRRRFSISRRNLSGYMSPRSKRFA